MQRQRSLPPAGSAADLALTYRRLSASDRSSRLSEQLSRCLHLIGSLFDPIEARQHTTLEDRQPRRMVKLAALVTVQVQGFKQHRHGETPPSGARLSSKAGPLDCDQ
ncbi:hypothetical protein X773_31115 [Mesorhizobium sp. LSJC285A00]|nr:hypothetical protein X773_31115 [Mesorhizobium sp. LSJC285A00]